MIQAQKINPKMVMLAREARGFTQEELADHAGINRSNISRFEQEYTGFSDETTEKIIKALRFPAEFFVQQGEILPPALYRKRDKVPAKILTQVDANINIMRINIAKLLNATQKEDPKLKTLATSPSEAAATTRKKWKLSKGPIEDLTEILEKNGVITVPIYFNTDRVDSRSILINGTYPVIFYNKSLLGDRLRFSLAYELGHLIMHTGTSVMSMDNIGHEANLFASEFLMPEKDIKPLLENGITLDLLAKLKKEWKVSMQAILYRADDLGLITENQKRYIIGQFNALKIRRREPIELDVPIERGHLLRDMITSYRTKQKMSVKEFAKFFCLSEEEFLERYSN